MSARLWLRLFVVIKEKRDLRQAFGASYQSYAARVPRGFRD